MSDLHTQDAYLAVTVPLPNGRIAAGKPIPFAAAMRLLALNDAFTAGGKPKETIVPMLDEFFALTGIDAATMADLTLGEVLDTVSRFFFWRRPARIEAPATVTAPVGSPPPSA